MLNDLDRFHLVMDVIDRVPGPRRARGRTCARRWSTRGCATAPTRASSATTRPTSATGPGRAATPARRARRPSAVRVLVVNAGSSSLKLTLLGERRRDARRARARRAARADRRRRADARRSHGRASPTPTPSATGSSTAASASASRCGSTSGRRAALRELDRPRAAAPAQVARGARRRLGARCPACRRSPASTPPSTRRCRRPRPPTRCRAVARALGAAPLRLPRAVARLGRAPRAGAARRGRRRAADRQLPPRRRRLAVRDRATAARSTRRWGSRRSRGS